MKTKSQSDKNRVVLACSIVFVYAGSMIVGLIVHLLGKFSPLIYWPISSSKDRQYSNATLK